jgi:GST-like protein
MERYRDESKRLLSVLEERLKTRKWLMGDAYTIADIATFPWVRGADVFYGGREALDYASFPAVMAWLERCLARPASAKGLEIPA